MPAISVSGGSGTQSLAAGSAGYVYIGSGQISTSATEAPVQRKCYKAGTYQSLYVSINVNTLSGNCTVKFRKNGADGNQVIVIPAGTTTPRIDTTHTDAIAVNDLIDISVVCDAGTGSITLLVVALDFVISGSAAPTVHYGASIGGGVAFPGTASAARFLPPAGAVISTTTNEPEAAPIIDVPGTFRNLQVYVTANTRTTSTTIQFRKNGANGNQVIAIGAGATGFFEDAVNTDAVVATNTFDIEYLNGTGGGAITITTVGVAFDSSVNGQYQVFGAPNTALTTTARHHAVLGAGNLSNPLKGIIGTYVTATNLRCYISANTRDATETVATELTGSGSTALTTSIGAAATGEFHDTTHSDTVYANDNYGLIRSNSDSVGSMTLTWSALTLQYAEVGTLAATLDAVTESAGGTVTVQGNATPTLDAVTLVATGTIPAVHGDLTQILDNVMLTGIGAITVKASATIEAAAETLGANLAVLNQANLAATLANVTAAANTALAIVGRLKGGLYGPGRLDDVVAFGSIPANNKYPDFIGRWLRGQPKFTGVLTGVTQAFVDLQQCMASIPGYLAVDAAIGAQLDVVGAWLGQPRAYRPGPATMGDATYRKLLNARILRNEWDGTAAGIQAILDSYFADQPDTHVFVQDQSWAGSANVTYTFRNNYTGDLSAIVTKVPMAYSVCVAGTLPDDTSLDLLVRGLIAPEPAGIECDYVVTTTDGSPLFGFDRQDAMVSGFDDGAWGEVQ